jgi:hypothetical protein
VEVLRGRKLEIAFWQADRIRRPRADPDSDSEAACERDAMIDAGNRASRTVGDVWEV